MADQFLHKSRAAATGVGSSKVVWFFAVALLSIAAMTGCHHAASSPESAAGGDQPSPKASRESSRVASNTTLSGPQLPGSKGIDTVVPPPKFVRRDQITAQFPDKTPQATWEIKLFSDGSKVYDGEHVEYYPHGTKFVQGRYVEGKKQGPWKFWASNGKPVKTENYRDGKLDGAWTLFHDDGSKERDESYQAGKRDGKWVSYDSGGKNQPVKQEEYKDGEYDGTVIEWYSNGNKKLETHYVAGKLDGQQSLWYRDEKPLEVALYKNGMLDGKRTRWKENGEPIDATVFRDGQPVSSTTASGK
ncbi:MAG TPA: toxin-antitoxin system YwqK family antitoxin [Pirellulales bacterium]|jgi:antitoxin component YwqK of YwqJK toxin-antitoxin module|nr:toxin-antitoxin system YwqK family antitoxin [Pirellulales bacterium]